MIPSRVGLYGARQFFVTIADEQVNYNLFTALGSPVGPAFVFVNILPGAVIRSDRTSLASPILPAFDQGEGWAPGTRIVIVNRGSIYGQGGVGGRGGTLFVGVGNIIVADAPPRVGEVGGAALVLRAPTALDNATGQIFGGGGGGGGSAAARWEGGNEVVVAGSGGGQGQGAQVTGSFGGSPGFAQNFMDFTAGIDGNPGNGATIAGRAEGGAPAVLTWPGPGTTWTGVGGGRGGSWGEAGLGGSGTTANTAGAPSFFLVGAQGGAGGNAIQLNGHILTWLSESFNGFTFNDHIKGDIS